MKTSHKLKIVFLAIAIAFFALSPAASAKSWPSKAIEDASKSWTITFNQTIDINYATNAHVYILDGTNKIPVTIATTDGNKAIRVTPTRQYEIGKEYQLKVESTLKSQSGKSLNEPVTMKFYLVDPGAAIQSVSQSSAAGFTNFTVFTRSDVHSVKIGTTEMQMSGKNKYSQGFYGMKPGDKVTIRAYGETGKVLESKAYTID